MTSKRLYNKCGGSIRMVVGTASQQVSFDVFKSAFK